jgi:hypothetical protein
MRHHSSPTPITRVSSLFRSPVRAAPASVADRATSGLRSRGRPISQLDQLQYQLYGFAVEQPLFDRLGLAIGSRLAGRRRRTMSRRSLVRSRQCRRCDRCRVVEERRKPVQLHRHEGRLRLGRIPHGPAYVAVWRLVVGRRVVCVTPAGASTRGRVIIDRTQGHVGDTAAEPFARHLGTSRFPRLLVQIIELAGPACDGAVRSRFEACTCWVVPRYSGLLGSGDGESREI